MLFKRHLMHENGKVAQDSINMSSSVVFNKQSSRKVEDSMNTGRLTEINLKSQNEIDVTGD